MRAVLYLQFLCLVSEWGFLYLSLLLKNLLSERSCHVNLFGEICTIHERDVIWVYAEMCLHFLCSTKHVSWSFIRNAKRDALCIATLCFSISFAKDH